MILTAPQGCLRRSRPSRAGNRFVCARYGALSSDKAHRQKMILRAPHGSTRQNQKTTSVCVTVPFRGQTSQILSILSPKWDCSPCILKGLKDHKRKKQKQWGGIPARFNSRGVSSSFFVFSCSPAHRTATRLLRT